MSRADNVLMITVVYELVKRIAIAYRYVILAVYTHENGSCAIFFGFRTTLSSFFARL